VNAVMSDHITIRVKSRTDQKAAVSRGGRADMLGRIVVDYSVSQSVTTNILLNADQ
jgi:hypothetical protein